MKQGNAEVSRQHDQSLGNKESKYIFPIGVTAKEEKQVTSGVSLVSSSQELVPLPTCGEGDCAIHAVLGQWDGSRVICSNPSEQRVILAKAMRQAARGSCIYQLMVEGIQEVIRVGTRIGDNAEELQKKYHAFLTEKNILSSDLWDIFAVEMMEHPSIGEYVAKYHQLGMDATDYHKFHDALNRNKNQLYELLTRTSSLHQAFDDYNRRSTSDFDWYTAISPQVIEEYIGFVSTPRNWLLPSEVAIMAEAFQYHINYYPALGAQVMPFSPRHKRKVTIRFNSYGRHFERLVTRAEHTLLNRAPVKNSLKFFPQPSTVNKNLFLPPLAAPLSPLSSTPITVDNLMTIFPPSDESSTYQVSHLLPAGTRGTIYQLQVFLNRLISLLLNEKLFSAELESKDLGNLDDSVIFIEDPQNKKIIEVESYQVKYYDHDIKSEDFIQGEKKKNKSDEKDGKEKKDRVKKMNIGKFFDGWLSLRAKFPHLKPEQIHCILYTNAGLDGILQKCMTGSRFNEFFIDGSEKIHLLHTKKLSKNFLTKLKNSPLPARSSSQVWDLLNKNKIIDNNGYFTKYATTRENFSIDLAGYPAETQKNINEHLEELRQWVQEDFFSVLSNNVIKYLSKKGKHPDLVQLSIDKKDEFKELFKLFLKSLIFQIKQPNLEATNVEIQKNIKIYLRKDPAQIFICLYYALQEWFLNEKQAGNNPRITTQLMKMLLKAAVAQSHDLIVLRTNSSVALKNISYVCGMRSIKRNELPSLQVALKKDKMIAVIGTKGIGKSGLVKQALTHYHPDHYLFIQASELLQDPALRERLLNVFQMIKTIELVVIDSAEQLLELPEKILKEFLLSLKKIDRTVLFTITAEAAHQSFFNLIPCRIAVEPLTVPQIMGAFPTLDRYQNIESVISLASIPFYLSAIWQLTERLSAERCHDLLNPTHTNIDAELINWVVQGKHASQAQERRLVWQHLAVKIASSKTGLSQFFALSPKLQGISLLISDSVLVARENEYRFSHDLFFEHGLLAFWLQKWEIATTEETLVNFWQQLPNQLVAPGTLRVLERWFLSYREKLKESLIQHAKIVAAVQYFHSLMAIAVISEDKDLLQAFLSVGGSVLSPLLHDVLNHAETTYILLALEYDAPVALQLLLQYGVVAHHPKAGVFTQQSSIARYRQEEKISCSENKAMDSESDENEGDDSNKENEGDSEEEEGFNLFAHGSDESEGEQSPNEAIEDDLAETPLTRFLDCTDKYFQIDFINPYDTWNNFDYDEDVIIDRSLERPEPNYNHYYIHIAAMQNKTRCLSVLIEYYKQHKQSPVLELRNEYDETPLHMAVLKRAYDCVNLLLAADVSIDVSDDWRETALHNAAYIDDMQLMQNLLNRGADPNHLNDVGLSPFHIALVNYNLEAVKFFLEHGADLSIEPFQNSPDDREVTVANLLARVSEKKGTPTRMEEFVLSLVRLLNYGQETENCCWGKRCKKLDMKKRQIQFEQVEQLMALVEHRARLSENYLCFEYIDEASELDYALENEDFDRLYELSDFILNDQSNITFVLQAELDDDHREALLSFLCKKANQEQSRNLQAVAEKEDDEILLELLDLGNGNEGDEVAENEGDEMNQDGSVMGEMANNSEEGEEGEEERTAKRIKL